jgi:[ribosomal protein S5]-alanine N-acetyltransferase
MNSELDLSASPVVLRGRRTITRLATVHDVRGILAYYLENQERFRPFDPERPPLFYEERFWDMQVRQNIDDYVADRALRLFIFLADDPGRVIGNIGFSNFVRGVGQYCTLGYAISGEFEGKGMMSESLRAAIDFAFRSLNFHRIEANYLPHNRRSGELLRRLGFSVEGYSRDYLRIAGVWEDHVRTGLINPHWTG